MDNIDTIYLEKLIIDNKFIEIINYFSENLNIHKDKIFLNDIGIINDICFNYNLNNNFEDFYIINNSNNILYINNKNYTNNLIYFDDCSFLTIFNNNNNNNNNVYFLVIKNICKDNKFELSKQILNRKKFSNNIFLLESFLNENDCNYFLNIIDYFIENNLFKKDIWREHNNVYCYACNISENNNSKIFKTIDKKLYKIIGDICKKLFIDFGLKTTGDSGYGLRKIYGETRLHSDNIFSDSESKNINKIRNMSLIINLNNNYEGGEFYFPIQDYKIKLKQGDVILFPPYWTHPHMVYSPINNTYRYTINTWLFQ